MRLFTANDILRDFTEQDRSRGRVYQNQGRVRELQIEDNGSRLRAKVQGESAAPYSVEIHIEKKHGRALIHSECTCPSTYMCKHAVATLFETLAQWDRQRERLPSNKPYEAQRKSTPEAHDKSKTAREPEPAERLVYFINPKSDDEKSTVVITPAVEKMLKSGEWGKPRHQSFQEIILQNKRKSFLTTEDHDIFRMINTTTRLNDATHVLWRLPENPKQSDQFLRHILRTNRSFSIENSMQPLKLAPEMPAELGWAIEGDGKQRPIIKALQPGLTVLMSNSPWYINPATLEAGPLRSKLSFEEVKVFLSQQPLTAKKAEALRQQSKGKKSVTPLPYEVVEDKKAKIVEPTPRLHVHRNPENTESLARLVMDYEGVSVDPLSPIPHYHTVKKDQLFLFKRNKKAEADAIKVLLDSELKQSSSTDLGFMPGTQKPGLYLSPVDSASPWFWLDFAHEAAPKLRKEGFQIEIDENCGMVVLDTDDDVIEASFTQSGEWWFSLDLGITINGQRTPLLPILVSFLKVIHSPADLERLTAGNRCYVPLPDGRHVALPSARVKTILQTLIELFGAKPLDEKGQLRVSFDLAAAISKIKDFTRKRWFGEGQLKSLVEKLGDFEGIEETDLPTGLKAELRHYQKEGYDWLHFLGTYNLGGVLADDMGLGKTVQALAYILSLKKKGKMGPCLVIMPTSLVTNWQTEAERFTPELKVLTLHGKDRAVKFSDIEEADIVLSTYPLVIRDVEKLKPHKWGLVILDEAQAIKNPTSKITQAVCMLEAKQRLCLTGTPLENHLGEIWSIFAFLMPGLLGDYSDFSRQYRIPIEKHADAERQNLLTRRLRPFILRRLKTNVASELPPKTEIIQRVTLADDQRDLYETVRHVMNDKVREEISNKGFARSHIVILDALLKLRQVCCDPRLVKLAAASKATSSAKLEALLEMLPTLIEDGRRILLFSQFTSMLDLIKPELENAGIPYVELRGTTKDRKTPITRFQNKEIPLFLISLKAGGTGLNLTAADTVIHFDPWWNPSVENQATDRAHRIGQDKPVFVYKLIADGTVEERILDLQTKKSNLANAIFGDTPAAAASLNQNDLKWLLESV